MKRIFFTPGPSQLLPRVPGYLNEAIGQGIPSLSHRSEEFRSIYKDTASGIRKVLGAPDGMHVFFMGSATEAMERIIQNCVEKESFHFVNGAFSARFFKIAQLLGKNPIKIESPMGNPFDFSSVDIPKSAELICITQNETSIGIAIKPENINRLKKDHPNALLAVDIVSCAPMVELDYSQVDMAFFSVQKCFGLPAGLGVLLANDRALQRSKELQAKGVSIGSYHNFQWMAEDEIKFQTPETPNVLAIYLLGRVCAQFLQKGIERVRADCDEKAALLYGFFDAHPLFHPFIEDRSSRSKTVIVIAAPQGSQPIIKKLKERGLVIGSGYSEYRERQFRIANFPAHSKDQMRALLDAISTLS
ncbi:MAG TPA: aminotransferase class V-fold PLP-dependent enzyme [Candidatus Nanoarchaeia archaeon]|nr:aminotransferase class V-fold PLP-dependent enzyme [Candidatus Nanoarchaeia archaeon]